MINTLPVSDLLSNLNDQVVNSARLMAGAKQRQSIFEAIYKGQRQEKSVHEIMALTGLTQIRVLNEGKRLGPLVEKVRGGFRKKRDLAPHYRKILSLARDKDKLNRVPTKVAPKIAGAGLRVRVEFPVAAAKAVPITVEDIDSFSKAKRRVSKRSGSMREEMIKNAFARIFGDSRISKDWGGEKSDFYTTKCRVKAARRATAIAFKGGGTAGKLVPAKMGKNGDQIDRLFDEPAEVFLVVYCGQIEPSIVGQMQAFAIAKKALNGQRVYFGVIDADDLGRIAAGYPEEFNAARAGSSAYR
jgi:hypothetical protein